MSQELVLTKKLRGTALIEENVKAMQLSEKSRNEIVDESADFRYNGIALAGVVGGVFAMIGALWAGIAYSSSGAAFGVGAALIAVSIAIGFRVTGTDKSTKERLSITLAQVVKNDLGFGKGEISFSAGAYSLYLSTQVKNREFALSYRDFLNSEYLESFKDEFTAMKIQADKNIEEKEQKFNALNARGAMAAIQPQRVIDHSVQYRKLVAKYSDIKKQWFETQSDIVQLLKYPMINDMSEPSVRNFHKELIRAENVFPDSPGNFDMNHPFVDCISNLEFSYQSMVNESKKVADSKFSPDERKKVSLAKDLMSIALNEAGTPNERQTAYKRALSYLEGLIVIPTAALVEVESLIRMKEINA